MPEINERLIATGASESYARQLLALLGSLNCNWPGHPPVLVYDLGLAQGTLGRLAEAGILVRRVPEFCGHWNKHFTWKFWCWCDAPAQSVFWLDAGCCVLRPMEEVFGIIEQVGYFAIPNHFSLEKEASEYACRGCGVEPDFRNGKGTIAAGIFGFRRGMKVEAVVKECLNVAMVEEHIKAHEPAHRHDQQILSLLLYRDVKPLVLCDGMNYAYDLAKRSFANKAIWAARRTMTGADLEYFGRYVAVGGQPHMPQLPRQATLLERLIYFPRRFFKKQRIYEGLRP